MSNTILLVEDNQMAVELIISAFFDREVDLSIQAVQNGNMALEYILGEGKFSSRNEYPLPCIILLDLKIPGIDGFGVLKKLKNTPVLKRIPVIIFSSSNSQEDIEKCFDLGANSYIRKPGSFEALLNTIENIYIYWNSLNVFPSYLQSTLSMF